MLGVLLDMSLKGRFIRDSRRRAIDIGCGPLVDRLPEPPTGCDPEPVLHRDGDEGDILDASGQITVGRAPKGDGDHIIRVHAALPRSGRMAFASSPTTRSEEHTSELQSLMRISYAVFCLKKHTTNTKQNRPDLQEQSR